MLDRYEEMWNLAAQESFDQALSVLQEIERSRPLSPAEFVAKGRWIQLSESPGYDLSDARTAFQEALQLDSSYVPALQELGWYYLAVDDDASKALGFFERALRISQYQFLESVVGKAQCIEESESSTEADAFVRRIQSCALPAKAVEDWRRWENWPKEDSGLGEE